VLETLLFEVSLEDEAPHYSLTNSNGSSSKQ